MKEVHALNRSSPKGGPFRGTCLQCGQTDLPMSAVGKPCENPANLSQDEALMRAMEAVETELAPHGPSIDVVQERAAFETWWRMWCPDRDMPSSASHVFSAWLARARAINPLWSALQQISRLRPVGAFEKCKTPRKLVEQMEVIALRALTETAPKSVAIGHAWTGDGTRCPEDGYDGPICARCGHPDTPDTGTECEA